MSESNKKASQDKMVEALLKTKAEKAAKKAQMKKDQQGSASSHAPKFTGNIDIKGHNKAFTPRMMSRAKKG